MFLMRRFFCAALCAGLLAMVLSGCAPAPAASSAAAVNSSPEAVSSSAPASAPASTPAPQPSYTQATHCYLGGQGTAVALYAQPEEGAQVIQPSIYRFYALETKGDWVYGCWGNELGWVSADVLSALDENRKEAFVLPQALNGEQQLQFLRATALFNAYICNNEGLLPDYNDTAAYNDEGWNAFADKAFSDYAAFEAAMHSLFTQEYLASRSSPEYGPMYHNIDGKLYISEGDRGRFGCAVEGYTVQEQTDSRIAFTMNFVFTTPVAEHRCSLPVEMTNTPDGWRFSDFTSGADDLRWMEAMGPAFDPWEGNA